MRSVQREVGEERPVAVLLDPLEAFAEEYVGAIAFVLLDDVVVRVPIVEVVVAPGIGRLRGAAAPADDRLVEAAFVWPEGEVVAQVPLAEQACRVAVVLEDLRQRRLLESHDRAAGERRRDAAAEGVAPGQQPGPGGSAQRVNMEVREPHRVGMESVHVRRVDDSIAVAAEVAVALVVGDHQDDVGFPAMRGLRTGGDQGRRS